MADGLEVRRVKRLMYEQYMLTVKLMFLLHVGYPFD
jgi:hypothetical protein